MYSKLCFLWSMASVGYNVTYCILRDGTRTKTVAIAFAIKCQVWCLALCLTNTVAIGV